MRDSALLVTSHCTLHRKIVSVHLRVGHCVSRKGGTGGGGWGHPQGDMHLVAVRLGFEKAICARYPECHLPP